MRSCAFHMIWICQWNGIRRLLDAIHTLGIYTEHMWAWRLLETWLQNATDKHQLFFPPGITICRIPHAPYGLKVYPNVSNTAQNVCQFAQKKKSWGLKATKGKFWKKKNFTSRSYFRVMLLFSSCFRMNGCRWWIERHFWGKWNSLLSHCWSHCTWRDGLF